MHAAINRQPGCGEEALVVGQEIAAFAEEKCEQAALVECRHRTGSGRRTPGRSASCISCSSSSMMSDASASGSPATQAMASSVTRWCDSRADVRSRVSPSGTAMRLGRAAPADRSTSLVTLLELAPRPTPARIVAADLACGHRWDSGTARSCSPPRGVSSSSSPPSHRTAGVAAVEAVPAHPLDDGAEPGLCLEGAGEVLSCDQRLTAPLVQNAREVLRGAPPRGERRATAREPLDELEHMTGRLDVVEVRTRPPARGGLGNRGCRRAHRASRVWRSRRVRCVRRRSTPRDRRAPASARPSTSRHRGSGTRSDQHVNDVGAAGRGATRMRRGRPGCRSVRARLRRTSPREVGVGS